MRIDDYLGLVVVVELDTTAIHEGVLEDAEGTHVKVINGAETWVIPRNEIAKITPVRTIGFKLK
ncbi:hypothetical protein [Paenibacillus prosopidis]|uniref:Uncharacterized protein n=1 Tax=Paenibacillus prosopidis TaxID=630520 RepID=A0A368VJY7_9BACL|nr:hypothetical protein [Paenibacillus prosopidis]RCW41674.1 hypothetical protein DFP97_122110 [Paenibacillus prosopidis]